jgi:GNAT superfamily N-acetyltransferase
MSRPVDFRRAVQAPEYDAARRLLREYQAAIDVDLCFQGFDAELADLPARYAGGDAGLWLAWAGALPLGCVALVPAGGSATAAAAELKRLYVRPEAQRQGIGRGLVETALAAAQAAGYASVRLETLTRLRQANRLYEDLGFVEVADFTTGGRACGTRFLARPLRARDRPSRRPRRLGAQLG